MITEQALRAGIIAIPSKFLVELNGKLLADSKPHPSATGSIDSIKTHLVEKFHTDFAKKYPKLYFKLIDEGVPLSPSTLRRTLDGKLGSDKANGKFKVKYSILDVMCYISWEKSLLTSVANENENWGDDDKYTVEIPEYAKDEINDFLNHRSVESKFQVHKPDTTNNLSINKVISNPSVKNLMILDDNYWEVQRQYYISDRQRISYLADLNSSPRLLPKIIANEFYIKPPESLIKSGKERETILIDELFNSVESQRILIKISDSLGQGKSTWCLHLAYKFKSSHFVLFVEDIEESEQYGFPEIDEDKPVLLLVDNCTKKPIYNLILGLKEFYKSRQIIVCLFDQTIRYKNISNWSDIVEEFDEIFPCKVPISETFFNEVLEKLLNTVDVSDEKLGLSNNSKWLRLQKEFLASSFLSLVDKIYSILDFLNQTNTIKYTGFDWQVWNELTKNEPSILKHLFCIVATYFQFGRPVPLGMFQKDPINEQELIIKFLSADTPDEKDDYPILIENDHLFLRHEYLAKRYFDSSESHKNYARRLFVDSLQIKRSEDYVRLFRNIYWHNDFENSFLITAFSSPDAFYKKSIILFEQYYKTIDISVKNDEAEKTLMELSKLYFEFDKPKSYKLLRTIIENNQSDDVHARTLLASYFTSEGLQERIEALELLRTALRIQSDSFEIIRKIPKLFYKLSMETEFSYFNESLNMFRADLISLKSLCILTKIFYLISPQNLDTLKLIKFLDGDLNFNKSAHLSWLHLQATMFLDQRNTNFKTSYLIFKLSKTFLDSREYTKTLKLFLFMKGKYLRPPNRIQLINCYLGLQMFKSAKKQLDFFRLDKKSLSRKIYLLKLSELFYESNKVIKFLKTVKLYVKEFGMDSQFEKAATFLHRRYLNPYDKKYSLKLIEEILEYSPQSISFRSLLIYLACLCYDLICIRNHLEIIKSVYTSSEKTSLLTSLLQLSDECKTPDVRKHILSIIKQNQ